MKGIFIHRLPFAACRRYFSVDSLLWEKRNEALPLEAHSWDSDNVALPTLAPWPPCPEAVVVNFTPSNSSVTPGQEGRCCYFICDLLLFIWGSGLFPEGGRYAEKHKGGGAIYPISRQEESHCHQEACVSS